VSRVKCKTRLTTPTPRRRNAVPIDPIALPLQGKECATAHLGGWFSALLDSGPDAWSQQLIDRSVGPQDQRGYLLHAYGEPVGALIFSAVAATQPQAGSAGNHSTSQKFKNQS
jgi:serine/threonine-protein kinase HipA